MRINKEYINYRVKHINVVKYRENLHRAHKNNRIKSRSITGISISILKKEKIIKDSCLTSKHQLIN